MVGAGLWDRVRFKEEVAPNEFRQTLTARAPLSCSPFKEQTHYPGTHAPQADLGWKLHDISCFSILVPLVTFSMRMTRSHQHAWIECNVSLLRDHELTPAPGSHHRFWFFYPTPKMVLWSSWWSLVHYRTRFLRHSGKSGCYFQPSG